MRFLIPLLTLFLGSALGAAQRPNFVVVFIDDMGWADLSCFGNRDAKTPNLDRLATEGLRFHQFYVNAPICSPSRCALTTGRYPQHWRITSFLESRASNERRGMAQWLDPEAPTLPRLLQQAGYATGHFGKWHLGGQRDVDDAPAITRYGFDESLTNFEGMGAKFLPLTLKPGDTTPGRIWEDAERLGGPVVWKLRSEITTGFVEAAVPFIDRAVRAKKPFYVNLWPDDVHSPFWPSTGRWAADKRGRYLAVLEEMDQQLGRLFDRLRDTPGLSENTIVIACSDNGHEPGAGTAGGFRGSKGMLFEGGIRSPLIVWAPGRIPAAKAGSIDDTSVLAAFDVAPSFLALAGLAAPEGVTFDGEDRSAVLTGTPAAERQRPIFWRRPPDRKRVDRSRPLPDLAVREGKWKLLCDFDGGRPRLHDVLADPGEARNLAAEHPGIATRLTEAATTWNATLPPDGRNAAPAPR